MEFDMESLLVPEVTLKEEDEVIIPNNGGVRPFLEMDMEKDPESDNESVLVEIDDSMQIPDKLNELEEKYYKDIYLRNGVSVQNRKIHCTACNIHLGSAPDKQNNRYIHPLLKVIVCKKCLEFYFGGEFERGEDGSELYCRWCGQGGQVFCCSNEKGPEPCPYVFCKKCIKRNFGKPMIQRIDNLDDWFCFICDPTQLIDLRLTSFALWQHTQEQIKLAEISKVAAILKQDFSQCCNKNTTQKKTTWRPLKPKLDKETDPDFNPFVLEDELSNQGKNKKSTPSKTTQLTQILSNFPQSKATPTIHSVKPETPLLKIKLPSTINAMVPNPFKNEEVVCTPDMSLMMNSTGYPSTSQDLEQRLPNFRGSTLKSALQGNLKQHLTKANNSMLQGKKQNTPSFLQTHITALPDCTVRIATNSSTPPSKLTLKSGQRMDWLIKAQIACTRIENEIREQIHKQRAKDSGGRIRTIEDIVVLHNDFQKFISEKMENLNALKGTLKMDFIQNLQKVTLVNKPTAIGKALNGNSTQDKPQSPSRTIVNSSEPVIIPDDDEITLIDDSDPLSTDTRNVKISSNLINESSTKRNRENIDEDTSDEILEPKLKISKSENKNMDDDDDDDIYAEAKKREEEKIKENKEKDNTYNDNVIADVDNKENEKEKTELSEEIKSSKGEKKANKDFKSKTTNDLENSDVTNDSHSNNDLEVRKLRKDSKCKNKLKTNDLKSHSDNHLEMGKSRRDSKYKEKLNRTNDVENSDSLSNSDMEAGKSRKKSLSKSTSNLDDSKSIYKNDAEEIKSKISPKSADNSNITSNSENSKSEYKNKSKVINSPVRSESESNKNSEVAENLVSDDENEDSETKILIRRAKLESTLENIIIKSHKTKHKLGDKQFEHYLSCRVYMESDYGTGLPIRHYPRVKIKEEPNFDVEDILTGSVVPRLTEDNNCDNSFTNYVEDSTSFEPTPGPSHELNYEEKDRRIVDRPVSINKTFSEENVEDKTIYPMENGSTSMDASNSKLDSTSKPESANPSKVKSDNESSPSDETQNEQINASASTNPMENAQIQQTNIFPNREMQNGLFPWMETSKHLSDVPFDELLFESDKSQMDLDCSTFDDKLLN